MKKRIGLLMTLALLGLSLTPAMPVEANAGGYCIEYWTSCGEYVGTSGGPDCWHTEIFIIEVECPE